MLKKVLTEKEGLEGNQKHGELKRPAKRKARIIRGNKKKLFSETAQQG